MGLDVIEIPQAAIRDYPGGYERWYADMAREANAHPVKSVTRGTEICQDRQSITDSQKNAGDGSTGRHRDVPTVPNQTEQRYRDEFLIPRILSGEIAECVFEGRTFELAHRCTYTPDWWCRLADGQEECHEVKGAYVWDDSRVKCKVAARQNPGVRFIWGQWRGGEWRVRAVQK